MHLCQVANAECDWRVWHSQEQIAHLQGLSRRTVQNALTALKAHRLIYTTRHEHEFMGRNSYQVNTAKVELMSTYDASEADEKISEIKARTRDQKQQQRMKATAEIRPTGHLRLVREIDPTGTEN